MAAYRSKRALRDPSIEIRHHDDGLIELVRVPLASDDAFDFLSPLDATGCGFVADGRGGVDFYSNGDLVPKGRWWMAAHAKRPAPPDVEEPKALADYRLRIGGERKSFRRYVVREPSANGYHRDKFLISLKPDGDIAVRSYNGKAIDENDPVLPNEEERTAIKAAIALAKAEGKWPTSINATEAKLSDLRKQLKKQGGVEPELFVFRAPRGATDPLLFVQQRIEDEKGKKADVPWSFWSDGRWRCMEPDHLDGGLPLFGLEQLDEGVDRVFVHEGPKAAYHIQCLTGGRTRGFEAQKVFEQHPHLRDCPWRGELSAPGTVHIGWPGGGPNAWRVDWSSLVKLPPNVQVIIVCDHDAVGEEAVTAISRRLKRSMSALRFDNSFPTGFDLADPWPKEEDWWNGSTYVGPSLGDMLEPATWATDIIAPVGKGRPSAELRKEFSREWFLSKEPDVFIHRDYCDRLYKLDVFNALVRPFSDAEDTARLLRLSFHSQVGGVRYKPTKKIALRKAEVTNIDGVRLVNTFRPPSIVPVKGDASPWLDFMTHLIPDERDRLEMQRWCATLIERPNVRMLYGLLLISEAQGVGKTTLGEAILAPLVGLWNVSFPSEGQLLNPNYNSWAAHKRLVVCNEIYSGQSRAAYDKLKSVMTDRYIDVHRKYIEEYSLENYLHILACSNSIQALHLDPEDRRWFVPRVTEQKKPESYWRDFNRWLTGGGHGIIAAWAGDFLKANRPVDRGQDAPISSRKAEVIAASRSEGARTAHDLGLAAIELMKTKQQKIVLAVDEVRGLIAGQRGIDIGDKRLEKALTLRKAFRQAGMFEPERRDGDDEGRRFQVKSGENKTYVVANFPITREMEWADLKPHHIAPDRLLKM